MSGNKNVHYKSDEYMSRSQLASFLRTLADRIESGTVVLTRNDDETRVEIGEQVELEVQYETKHKPKGARHQLELEIEWGEGAGGGVGLA
ncbi:MAG: amphi-Trp domain-containing protein [Spirochaetaceae bacterium]